MAILNELGRKSPKGKALLSLFYVSLIFGSMIMVIPFLLMVSGSMKGQYNVGRMNLLPRYLYDDLELYKAWSESKYIEVGEYNSIASVPINNFSELNFPKLNPRLKDDYLEFTKSVHQNKFNQVLGHVTTSNQNLPENNLAFIQYLNEKFGSLEICNQKLKLNMPNWQSLAGSVLQQKVFQRSFIQNESLLMKEFYAFSESAKFEDFYFPGINGQFRSRMIMPFSSPDIQSLTDLTGLDLQEYTDIHFIEQRRK